MSNSPPRFVPTVDQEKSASFRSSQIDDESDNSSSLGDDIDSDLMTPEEERDEKKEIEKVSEVHH